MTTPNATPSKSSCDHTIGSHGGRLIRRSKWPQTLGEFAGAVHFFNTTKLAVPHPGFVEAHAFCCDCGTKLNVACAEASISEALNEACDAAVGSGEQEPSRSAMTRETYVDWLLADAVA